MNIYDINALAAALLRVISAPSDEPAQVQRLLPTLTDERKRLGDCPAGRMLGDILDYWSKYA